MWHTTGFTQFLIYINDVYNTLVMFLLFANDTSLSRDPIEKNLYYTNSVIENVTDLIIYRMINLLYSGA